MRVSFYSTLWPSVPGALFQCCILPKQILILFETFLGLGSREVDQVTLHTALIAYAPAELADRLGVGCGRGKHLPQLSYHTLDLFIHEVLPRDFLARLVLVALLARIFCQRIEPSAESFVVVARIVQLTLLQVIGDSPPPGRPSPSRNRRLFFQVPTPAA